MRPQLFAFIFVARGSERARLEPAQAGGWGGTRAAANCCTSRSSPAIAARVFAPTARRSDARSGARIAMRRTGHGRFPASAIRARGCCIVGLAPAAHGANRTGRVFTGDGVGGSGDFLMSALHRAGFANIPTSQHRADGLTLRDAYITAAVRCAPPANKPTPEEVNNCLPHLEAELAALPRVRVVVALGKIGFDAYLQLLKRRGVVVRPRPRFGHALAHDLPNGQMLIGCYHPSRQNTNTGKLTARMMDDVFRAARLAISRVRFGVRVPGSEFRVRFQVRRSWFGGPGTELGFAVNPEPSTQHRTQTRTRNPESSVPHQRPNDVGPIGDEAVDAPLEKPPRVVLRGRPSRPAREGPRGGPPRRNAATRPGCGRPIPAPDSRRTGRERPASDTTIDRAPTGPPPAPRWLRSRAQSRVPREGPAARTSRDRRARRRRRRARRRRSRAPAWRRSPSAR